MLIKIGILLVGFVFGYSICGLMTASKMASIREEANEYIEHMRKTFEERYNEKN